jgi:anti-sigma B factor antagonist
MFVIPCRGYRSRMSAREISLIRQDSDGCCVIVLTGEHDLSSVEELRTALDQAASAHSIVVDLSETAFIDSAVLGALIASHRRAGEDGHRWALVVGGGSGAAVRRILELTGLDSVMPLHDTREDAMAEPFPSGSGLTG